MKEGILLQLHGETFARRYQVASLAITAAASGDLVRVVLSFDALLRWVRGGFDDPAPGRDEEVAARHRGMGLPPPSEMLEEARRLGAQVIACETLIRLAGLEVEEAADRLDDTPGLAEIHAYAKEAKVALYV